MMQSGILFETEPKQDSYWQQQAKSILWLGVGGGGERVWN